MTVDNKAIEIGDFVLINWDRLSPVVYQFWGYPQLNLFSDLERNDCTFEVINLYPLSERADLMISSRYPSKAKALSFNTPLAVLHKIY